MALYSDYYETFLGVIEIRADEKSVLALRFGEKKSVKQNYLTVQCKEWLEHYFQKKKMLSLPPIQWPKREFRRRVYESVLAIPFGSCRSYREVAKICGNERAYRAVATALRYNPFILMIPCHRVIGSKGLGGYNQGLEIKRKLLEFEKCESINF